MGGASWGPEEAGFRGFEAAPYWVSYLYCKGKTPVVDEPNDEVSYTTWGSSLDIY